jgi:hypothetical protein
MAVHDSGIEISQVIRERRLCRSKVGSHRSQIAIGISPLKFNNRRSSLGSFGIVRVQQN